MRALVLFLASFCGVGIAHANPYETPDYRAGDYAATAYYRIDFSAGDGAAARHVLGLRMVSERAQSQGAPALLRAEWAPSGVLSELAVSGLALGRSRLLNRANGSNDDSLQLIEEKDPSCTGVGQPRADCAGEGVKRSVQKTSWLKSMFGDLGWAELLTAAAALGIVVVGAYSASQDDSVANTGGSP